MLYWKYIVVFNSLFYFYEYYLDFGVILIEILGGKAIKWFFDEAYTTDKL